MAPLAVTSERDLYAASVFVPVSLGIYIYIEVNTKDTLAFLHVMRTSASAAAAALLNKLTP